MYKSILSAMVFGLLLVFSCISAFSQDIVVLGVEGGEAELHDFQQKLGGKFSSISVLKAKVKLFDNKNSYVQLYHPETNKQGIQVAFKDCYIVLPDTLDSDTLMETLIKVRAAQSFGATSVTIYSRIGLEEILVSGLPSNDLDLQSLLLLAGADQIQIGNEIKELEPKKLKRIKPAASDYLVGGSNYLELRNQIAALHGKTPVSFEDLHQNPSILKGRKIYWVYGNHIPLNKNFFTVLSQISWMKRNGAVVYLVSPYLPYARSDKPEYSVGVPGQGKLVADLIEGVGTDGIFVVRAHAPQSMSFFKIFSHELTGRELINQHLMKQDIDCVVSPDAGFQKDATKYVTELNKSLGPAKQVSLVVMNKERNTDGKERIVGGTGLEEVTGKNVVIIDDETASGGTLADVAQYLDENYHPKEIHAVVTHLAGAATKAFDSGLIRSLVVTDTLPIQVKHAKLRVIPIAHEIAGYIRSIEEKE